MLHTVRWQTQHLLQQQKKQLKTTTNKNNNCKNNHTHINTTPVNTINNKHNTSNNSTIRNNSPLFSLPPDDCCGLAQPCHAVQKRSRVEPEHFLVLGGVGVMRSEVDHEDVRRSCCVKISYRPLQPINKEVKILRNTVRWR